MYYMDKVAHTVCVLLGQYMVGVVAPNLVPLTIMMSWLTFELAKHWLGAPLMRPIKLMSPARAVTMRER